MPRNFFRRVEAVFPVEDTELRKEILETLRTYLRDNAQAKQLRPTGTYAKIPSPRRKQAPFSAQEHFMRKARESMERTPPGLEPEKLEPRAEPRPAAPVHPSRTPPDSTPPAEDGT
jgi:polyphosphate kinase